MKLTLLSVFILAFNCAWSQCIYTIDSINNGSILLTSDVNGVPIDTLYVGDTIEALLEVFPYYQVKKGTQTGFVRINFADKASVQKCLKNRRSQEYDSSIVERDRAMKAEREKPKRKTNLEPFKPICDYFKNEVDPFDKVVIKMTNPVCVWSRGNSYFELSMSSLDRLKTLDVHFSEHSLSDIDYCFNKYSKLEILLSNDSIVRLQYIGDVECSKSEFEISKYTNFSWYDIDVYGSFLLKSKDIQLLKKYKIKRLRIKFFERNKDIIFEKTVEPIELFCDFQGDATMYFQYYLKCIE